MTIMIVTNLPIFIGTAFLYSHCCVLDSYSCISLSCIDISSSLLPFSPPSTCTSCVHLTFALSCFFLYSISNVLCLLVLTQAYSISKELYYTHLCQCHVFYVIYYYSTVLGQARIDVCQESRSQQIHWLFISDKRCGNRTILTT